jgi:ubiquinone biosynthesis protein
MLNPKQVTKFRTTSKFLFNFATKFQNMNKVKRGDWIKDQVQLLGPTYVKIGQFVASRPYFIDDKNLINGLKKLQDSVTPLPWDVVQEVIVANIGFQHFKSVDQVPLAAASIAQVHRATLKTGENVVIKLKRPGIVEDITLDLQIIEVWLLLLSIFMGPQDKKIIDAQNMIHDIKNSVLKETDLTNEVANMQMMIDVTKENSKIKVPKVYKDLCTSDMIVMEYVPHVKFRVTRDPNMAYLLMDIFVQQFLQNGILHGDPHEGNVALSPDKKSVVMYDLGHVIYLDSKLRSQMKILVFEIMTENVDGVIYMMKQMPEIIEIRKESELRKYVLKYIQYIKTIDIKVLKSMSANEDQDIPVRFSGTIYEIVRVFGIVEGVCIYLDPDFKYENVFLKYV